MELEVMLHAFVDQMAESVAICDPEGRVLYANQAAARMFGRLDGSVLWERFPGEAGRALRAAFSRVAAGGATEALDGRQGDRWYATRIERVDDRVHVVAHDTTDVRRERTETDALRQRLLTLADALPALVAFVDHTRRYRYVNAAYEQWTGLPRDAMLGNRIDEVAPSEIYARIAPHVERALAGELAQFRTTISYSNGPRDVDVRCAPVRDGDTVLGFAVLVLDITSERALADSQRRTADQLEKLLDVTRRLALSTTADEVARAVIDAGIEALDATMAGLWLLEGDELVLARARGFFRPNADRWERVERSAPGPLADCVREGRPVWLASRADYAARYPDAEARFRVPGRPPIAFGAVPIAIDGATAGGLVFGFEDERRLTANDRAYLEVLAAHASDALARTRLHGQLVEALQVRQAIIEASPAAIVLLDGAGTVRAWNAAAERMFGWRPDEAIGRPLPSVSDEQHAELAERLREALSEGIASRFETTRRTRDGRTLEVAVHTAPVPGANGETLCLSLAVDISERKRVERGREVVAQAGALLAQSLDWEQTLAQVARLAIPSFADWCIVHLVEGDQLVAVVRSNPVLGRTPPVRHDPSRGGASLAIETGHTQVLADLDDAARRALARDDAQYERLRAAGMRSYLNVPMRAGGRVIGAFTFGARTRNFDALDRTIGEGLAAQAAGAIENARLYRDATNARAEAEAASRAKDEFLAMLGHELRNPLAPISTALQLMAVRPPPHEREREVIARQVGHLTRLVDDLLDISRITRGKIELARERTTLDAIAARAVELASPLLEERDHRLRVSIPADLHLDADPTRLAQVIANLLSNAARYTPPGGLIEIEAARDGREVVLVVRDNGIGIPPEALPVIFDAFVQGPRTLARTEGGLGLGLAIVKSIVALHGGRVAARSAGTGRGTELEVRLPAAQAEPTARRRTASQPRIAGPRRRVLIVDDNQDAAELLAELLDASGHEIRTAFDGPGALRVADEFAPEIALLDIGLPVMDGYELAERLRARYRELRLVAVTGYGQATDQERSRSAGFDMHLTKPVRLELLHRVLDS